MFKYNELSDLLNGELVTPTERTREGVICIDKNNNKVVYSFEDFDFNKKVSERNTDSDDSDDIIDFDDYEYEGEKSPDDKYEYLDDSSNDNSIDSSSDDSEEDSGSSTDLNKYGKEWILSDFEKAKILHKFGYRPKSSIRQVNIIKKEIN